MAYGNKYSSSLGGQLGGLKSVDPMKQFAAPPTGRENAALSTRQSATANMMRQGPEAQGQTVGGALMSGASMGMAGMTMAGTLGATAAAGIGGATTGMLGAMTIPVVGWAAAAVGLASYLFS